MSASFVLISGMNGATVEQLYNAHFNTLVREAISVTHSPDYSPDLVQDCFVKLIETNTITGDPHQYLRKMVRNKSLDFVRRRDFERETFEELQD